MAFDLDDEEYEATRKLYGVDKDFKEMTIEEAKKILKIASGKVKGLHVYQDTLTKAIECILTALNNSVSKDEIKAKIEQYHKFYVRNPEAYRKGNCRVAEVVLQELLNKGE